MNSIAKPLKVGLIVILVAIITIIHYSTIHGQLAQHIPHRELYFIPILLASFWFGLNFGKLIVAKRTRTGTGTSSDSEGPN